MVLSFLISGKVRTGLVAFIAVLLFLPVSSRSQCSCGGPPLLGSLETPPSGAGTWRVGLTFEFAEVSDFVTGTTELDDDIRDRNVKSGLLQIDYGLTNRLSFSGILTILDQDRTTRSAIGGSGQFLSVNGVGDAMVIAKYTIVPMTLQSQRQLSIGGGVKLPLGKSTIRGDNGVLIAADMQPGTGAWDGVLWGSFSQGLTQSRKLNMYASATFRFTGSTDRFDLGDANYRFGDEFVGNIGLGFRHSSKLEYTMGLRYRSAQPEESRLIAGNPFTEQPNSGGKWVNLSPGINLNLSQTLALRASGQLPLYRDLEGTQFSTTYSLSVSVFYTFLKNNPVINLL